MVDASSQSQIDALLKPIQNSGESKPFRQAVEQKAGTEETKYSRYDFYNPRKFTKEKMKTLTSVFENYVRILTSQVDGILCVMTDIMVLEVQGRRYYEYVNSLCENDCMTLVNTYAQDEGRNNVPFILYTTPGLVPTLINHVLGGRDEVVKVDASYRYSDVEVASYRRVAECYTQALKDGFSNYINVAFKVQGVKENSSMVQDVDLDETVVIIYLNVDVAGLAVEKARLYLPGTLLEYVFYTIDSRKHIARSFAHEDNKDIILDNTHYTRLPTTRQLTTVELNVNDIYHLKVGDVIDLNWPQNSKVKLFIGGQSWFSGDTGVHKKNAAVRIQDRVYKEPRGPLKMEELAPREPGNQEDMLQRLGNSNRPG